MIRVIASALSAYVIVWTASAVLGKYVKVQLARSIAAEMRPLQIPAVVVSYLLEVWRHGHPYSFWNLLGLICGVLNYWLLKDDDDDRWKRRRKKLAEKIERRGARLVVVQDGAS